MANTDRRGRMCSRHLPMATWGMTDGPARDPDRVTGNADRPRSRRASARRAEAAKDPIQGYSLALIDCRLLRGDGRTTEYRVEDRWSPSSSHRSTTDSIEATPTPPPGVASSFPASLRRFRRRAAAGPGHACSLHSATTSFGVGRRPSLVGGGDAALDLRWSHASGTDAQGNGEPTDGQEQRRTDRAGGSTDPPGLRRRELPMPAR